eukprot:4343459-Amphidinium_carterae.1
MTAMLSGLGGDAATASLRTEDGTLEAQTCPHVITQAWRTRCCFHSLHLDLLKDRTSTHQGTAREWLFRCATPQAPHVIGCLVWSSRDELFPQMGVGKLEGLLLLASAVIHMSTICATAHSACSSTAFQLQDQRHRYFFHGLASILSCNPSEAAAARTQECRQKSNIKDTFKHHLRRA